MPTYPNHQCPPRRPPTLWDKWRLAKKSKRVIVVQSRDYGRWWWQHETKTCSDDAHFPTHAEALAAALAHAKTHQEES